MVGDLQHLAPGANLIYDDEERRDEHAPEVQSRLLLEAKHAENDELNRIVPGNGGKGGHGPTTVSTSIAVEFRDRIT